MQHIYGTALLVELEESSENNQKIFENKFGVKIYLTFKRKLLEQRVVFLSQ
jgi:hypothetical protein